MSAKYRLFQGRDSQWYFTLHAANGERILQSEGYVTKSGATNGIQSVRAHSPHDRFYERLGSGSSLWFRLKASNGEIIGRGETYTTSPARETGIASVKVNGPIAPVE